MAAKGFPLVPPYGGRYRVATAGRCLLLVLRPLTMALAICLLLEIASCHNPANP